MFFTHKKKTAQKHSHEKKESEEKKKQCLEQSILLKDTTMECKTKNTLKAFGKLVGKTTHN